MNNYNHGYFNIKMLTVVIYIGEVQSNFEEKYESYIYLLLTYSEIYHINYFLFSQKYLINV